MRTTDRAQPISRRVFLRLGLGALAAPWLINSLASSASAPPKPADVAVARGGTIDERLRAALDAVGGIQRFIKPGARVVIKPNAAFAQPPQSGANTTPEVLEAVIRACFAAGAASVLVVEHCLSSHGTFGTDADITGLTAVARRAGAKLLDIGTSPANYAAIKLPRPMPGTHAVARAILEADAVINLPRLKTHPLAGYTMAVKNLMGTLRNPYAFHESGDAKLPLYIAALGAALHPHITLNIIDATDLVRGWAAGKPGRLSRLDALVVAPDLFAADAVAVTLFGDDPLARWKCACGDSYLRIAHAEGLGVADPTELNIRRIDLST